MMRPMRFVVILMVLGSLFGCGGGSDEPSAKVEDRAAATRAAAAEVFPLVGKAVEAGGYSSSGSGRWVICGMEPSPSGAEYEADVAITQANTGLSERGELIASALRSAGWKVDPPTGELVRATKDGMTFRADRGTNLSITSGCVDTSEDSVRTLTEKSPTDLGLPPAS